MLLQYLAHNDVAHMSDNDAICFFFFLFFSFLFLFYCSGATHAKRFSPTTLIDRSMQGVFFKEGDTSNVMFLILRGTANVVNKDPFTEVLRPVCPCYGFHC